MRKLTRSPWVQKAAGSLPRNTCAWSGIRRDSTVEPADALERIPKSAPLILAFWHGQHFLTPFIKPPTCAPRC